MLILTRRIGEEIVIGSEITVIVLSINGNQARIGIDAPKDVSVHRKEIHDRIKNEKKTHEDISYQDNNPGNENLRNKNYSQTYVDRVLERVNLRG